MDIVTFAELRTLLGDLTESERAILSKADPDPESGIPRFGVWWVGRQQAGGGARTCEECGATFEAARVTARFCRDYCRVKHWRANRG